MRRSPSMASMRQIQANLKNSALSTGPSESGKSRSRLNSTKHGLAGAEPGVEAERSPEFLQRLAAWEGEYPTTGPAARWALERLVGASLQIERCERALEGAIDHHQARACLSWSEDRAAEAAALASRLADDPPLIVARLEACRAGAELLLRRWVELDEALAGGEDWSSDLRARALRPARRRGRRPPRPDARRPSRRRRPRRVPSQARRWRGRPAPKPARRGPHPA